jgi:tRNA1(Val) A37 N6-methylase TrmN6
MTNPVDLRREGETLDAFYHGRVHVLQKKKGYRFSADAPLLADFIRTKADDEALEIGTGSGIISLLLSVKPVRRIVALEIQPGLAEMARRNVDLNGLGARIEVVEGDLRTYEPGRSFDLIFSNPPYIRKATGFLSRSPEKSAAKHELHGDIADILKGTAEWLAPGGRAAFVYPEARRPDFLAAAGKSGLAVRRLRFVHARAGEPPNLFLIELARASEIRVTGLGDDAGERRMTEAKAKESAARDAGHGSELMAPLVLFAPGGRYTPEAEAVFAGKIGGGRDA